METVKEERRDTVVGFFSSQSRLKGEIFIRFASRIMSVDTGQPLTILRIKRKRNEEPVDALVFSDSKRRKKGLNVFHFVQTVEQEDSWNTKDFQVFPLHLVQSSVALNATRSEFPRLHRRQQKSIRDPPPPSLAGIRPLQRPTRSSSNLRLPRRDHSTRLRRLSHIKNYGIVHKMFNATTQSP